MLQIYWTEVTIMLNFESFDCAFSCKHYGIQPASTCSGMKLSRKQICLLLMYIWRVGESVSEAVRNIYEAWGDNTIAGRTARDWSANFEAGENSLDNHSSSVCPQDAPLFFRAASLAFLLRVINAWVASRFASTTAPFLSKSWASCTPICLQENAQINNTKTMQF